MIAATGAAALLAGLAGCSAPDEGGQDKRDNAQGDSEANVATKLDQAQLVEFGEAKVDAEHTEQGTYAELSATQQTEELRESTNLDKPDCVNAVDPWTQLPEVRDAPASLANYPQEGNSITHTLLKPGESTATEAVRAEPPEECSSYQATLEDGTTTVYTIRELDLDTVGDESRAFVAGAEAQGEAIHKYTLVYRNNDHLATATVLGAEESSEHEETLLEFAQAAVERENQVLA
ncbi:hypothetical protein F4561_005982 [Lipingzhangella halophila]|uniref:Uncharacterized protein n=1 Tax=Lipingzhangella halophila TaxID=1783352 RepID=A0A7W7RN64_9ACTN|nr:hypothetical protein [Lipingzhangella halophila]MBB4935088.1 hypothetical protein [Lipingzhangella halophila]